MPQRTIPPWRQNAPVLLAIGLLAFTLWLWYTQVDGGRWQPHHTIGLVLAVPCILLWARARHDLGASFTGAAEARALITRGLYSRIRHPIYLFGTGAIVGVLTFLGLSWLWLILVFTIPMQLLRARREDRVLEAAFGEDYRGYRRRSWL